LGLWIIITLATQADGADGLADISSPNVFQPLNFLLANALVCSFFVYSILTIFCRKGNQVVLLATE
jgi:hypothetical protein